MIIDIIDKYTEIIESYDILKFSMTDSSYCLVYEVKLINNTCLFAGTIFFRTEPENILFTGRTQTAIA